MVVRAIIATSVPGTEVAQGILLGLGQNQDSSDRIVKASKRIGGLSLLGFELVLSGQDHDMFFLLYSTGSLHSHVRR